MRSCSITAEPMPQPHTERLCDSVMITDELRFDPYSLAIAPIFQFDGHSRDIFLVNDFRPCPPSPPLAGRMTGGEKRVGRCRSARQVLSLRRYCLVRASGERQAASSSRTDEG